MTDTTINIAEPVPMPPELPNWLPKEALDMDISPNWLNADQELDLPPYMLSMNGVGFGAVGSIGAITGQKKNGKTLLETLFMAAVLMNGESLGPLRYELKDTRPNPKVLFIDTEQEESFALMVQRRVHYLLRWDFRENNDRFRVLWLHDEEDYKTRWLKAKRAIWEMQPDFIVLDGCRDMVSDINEAIECTQYIRQTMKIATDNRKCLLYQALHYNPGSEKMRGWLGTELGNRIAEQWESVKENKNGIETFTGTATDTRGKTPSPLEYFVDDTKCKFGIPMPLDSDLILERMDQEIVKRDTADLFDKLRWLGAEVASFGRIRETLKKQLHVGSSKAERMISDAKQYGVLLALPDDPNKFTLNLTKDAIQQTIQPDSSNSMGDSNDDPF